MRRGKCVTTTTGRSKGAMLSDHRYIIIGMFFESKDAVSSGDGIVEGAVEVLVNPTPGRMCMMVCVNESGRTQFNDKRQSTNLISII